jgi:cephalosporin hydroxylase
MFNEENINRKSNLEENDSLSCFMGHCAQQNPNVFKVFYDFLNEKRPSRIIEIGTAMGGFTMFLKITCNELGLDIPIRTYDINGRHTYQEMIESGIDVRIEDIFSSDYQEINQEVIDFIKDDGTTLVLCDGGNKIAEFNILSKFIKPGDYIMAHDYAFDEQYFKENINNKLWNWLEIQESDISTACSEYNLESYNQEVFQTAVWVCKIKK